MNVNCPNCEKQLKLGAKAEASISQMPPGKIVKVKCAQCDEAFGIGSDKKVVNLSANIPKESVSQSPTQANGRETGARVKPPEPPDLAWLIDGVFEDHEVVEEVPLALVMMNDTPERLGVINAIEGIGYRAEIAGTSEEAIEKMQFVNYSNVVLHSKFEGAGINSSSFHQYMYKMDMSKRRYIFYTLIGPEFKTLYDLQALSYSANLVVNNNEVKDFNVILRKVIPEYEALFGPLMEELHIQRR